MIVEAIPRLVDHLWYPILVPMGGYCRIVEMQGQAVNEWNDMVRRQYEQYTKDKLRGRMI